jgi:hypothetical protein
MPYNKYPHEHSECRLPMCSAQCAASIVHVGQECQLLKQFDLKISMDDPEGHVIYCVSISIDISFKLDAYGC